MAEALALTPDNVEQVLDEMRPYLMADGGNVELVEIEWTDCQITTSRCLWHLPQLYDDFKNGNRASS